MKSNIPHGFGVFFVICLVTALVSAALSEPVVVLFGLGIFSGFILIFAIISVLLSSLLSFKSASWLVGTTVAFILFYSQASQLDTSRCIEGVYSCLLGEIFILLVYMLFAAGLGFANAFIFVPLMFYIGNAWKER